MQDAPTANYAQNNTVGVYVRLCEVTSLRYKPLTSWLLFETGWRPSAAP